MRNRSQKIRLGVFLVVSVTTLVLVIAFFTAREFFKKEDIFFISYEDVSVSGLDVGSPVKYMGINIGTIKDIGIDPGNVNRVIVELSLKPETPIKENARANIISLGITGLKAIEISGASNEARSLKPGSYILAGSSFADDITGKAEIITQKAERVLNNLIEFTQPQNLDKITALADQARITLVNIDTLLAENREDIRQTIMPLKSISMQLDESSRLILEVLEAIHQKAQSDTLDEIFANVRDVSVKLKEADIVALVENIARLATQTEEMLNDVDSDLDRSSQDFSESLQLLKQTLTNLNEASMKINSDPSVLFKGNRAKNIPDHNLKE